MPDGKTAVNKTRTLIQDIEILDDLSKRYRMKTVLDDNSLVISNTRVRDTGIYRCVASNPLGEDTESVNVTVHDGRLFLMQNRTPTPPKKKETGSEFSSIILFTFIF